MSARFMRDRRGFSLIEAAIVLSVIGLVVGGIWVAAAALIENLRIKDFVSSALTVQQNTAQLFKNNQVSTAVTFSGPTALNLGLLDGSTWSLDSSNLILHQWGRHVIIDLLVNGQMRIHAINLPINSCINIVSAIAGADKGYNLTQVNFPGMGSPGLITTFPFIATQTQCASAVFGQRRVIFTFTL